MKPVIVRDQKGQYAIGTIRHANGPALERFTVDETTGCWNWLGKLNKGYGRCKRPGTSRIVPAHRLFYEHHIGPIPAGLDIDHLCRNRACVNPEHLEPVTKRENARRGAAAKLTPTQAIEIRDAVDHLCEKYGVKPRTLAAIGERKIWNEVV